jgi:malate dehydrogenase (oxaloacetate-decarboxylating)(NADP+)
VFAEGEESKIIRAAHQVKVDGIGTPILLGNPQRIAEQIHQLGINFNPEIINPNHNGTADEYAHAFYELRKRKGQTVSSARQMMHNPYYFGPMMVYMEDADCYLGGLTAPYNAIIRPALQIIHTRPEVKRVSGVYLVMAKGKPYLFTDATVNIDPSAEDLAEIAILANDFAKNIIAINPIVAMLSFSNFGATDHPFVQKVQHALCLVKERRPDMVIDGEVQADVAVSAELMEEFYDFSEIRNANVLVFPDLASANIAYKLMGKLGGADVIGPILLGLGAPVHVLQQGDSVEDIVTMASIAVTDAQNRR